MIVPFNNQPMTVSVWQLPRNMFIHKLLQQWANVLLHTKLQTFTVTFHGLWHFFSFSDQQYSMETN